MPRRSDSLRVVGLGVLAMVLIWEGGAGSDASRAGEPDSKTYWKVDDLRPGMKGVGRTVMVGTKLEEFEAVVLGVMKDVSPGRDMVLCRLKGCNLEHAGIIQGMSGSPIYIDGKLLGAVAFAWEFAKDPIAGVTPFSQMVEYTRSGSKRVAVESRVEAPKSASFSGWTEDGLLDAIEGKPAADPFGPIPTFAGGLAGMRPIATPVAGSGFSPRVLSMLADRFEAVGLAPMSGGAATERILKEEGDKPLVPGSPLSIALVTGDFDLSGIGTVTHVEGDRVYGFGHPMFSLGECEFPMMTGYIHTVYPRASVSMKMGSPLRTVGVIDTDVSTGVSGRVGPKPDMLPMTVRVKTGRYADPHEYKVEIVREPNLLPTMVLSVLMNAVDTEGNLPDELTAKLDATFHLNGRDPIKFVDTVSGQRYSGPMAGMAIFSPLSSVTGILVRNAIAPIRINSIECDIEIANGRAAATIEGVRLSSDKVRPGESLKAYVTVKPYKSERKTIEVDLPIPGDWPEGSQEAVVCDLSTRLRRRFRNEPQLLEPRDVDGIIRLIRAQTEPRRSQMVLAVTRPDKGVSIQGRPLPNLPASALAVFSTSRQTPEPMVRSDLSAVAETPWVLEGSQSIRFTVSKDPGFSSESATNP